ncbi:MFS transporter [Streptomyces sp. NPDC096323]|uniref:MFS transporter n=1 Tax=Streptomyces sp. NPDC096323 TaxID=3155822 RepID=UPI00331B15F3
MIYGVVLGSPYVARLLGGTLIGRLPNGMAPVAIVLWALPAGRGIALGGLLSALYGLASALSQPVKGRLMDRYGQGAVHLPAAALNSSLLIALPLAAPHGGTALATAIVVAAGSTAPPLEAGLRSLWPRPCPTCDFGTPLSLWTQARKVCRTSSVLSSPPPSPPFTARLPRSLSPPPLVSSAPSSLRPRRHPAVGAPRRRPVAHVREAGWPARSSRHCSFALAGVGCAIGALNVLAVALSDDHGRQMLSGLLPAAFSSGSFLGGLVYGCRTWPGSTARQLLVCSAAFLGGWLVLLAVHDPYAATAAVALPGAFLTVVVAGAYVTTDALTPTGRTSEAYAWLICSIGVGQAAGIALAGRLADHALALAALPASGAAFALAVLLLTRPHQGDVLAFAQHPTEFPPPSIGDPPCPKHQQSRS